MSSTQLSEAAQRGLNKLHASGGEAVIPSRVGGLLAAAGLATTHSGSGRRGFSVVRLVSQTDPANA